jgi:hypothetical protein
MTVVRKCNKKFTDWHPVITSKISQKRQLRIEQMNVPNTCIMIQRIRGMPFEWITNEGIVV